MKSLQINGCRLQRGISAKTIGLTATERLEYQNRKDKIIEEYILYLIEKTGIL